MAGKMAFRAAALICAASFVLRGQGLDVPLTVEETHGTARVSEPVTFGVPLPEGMVRDTSRLRLIGPAGRPVAASFRVANRWWKDGSVQWVHADFFADVGARNKAVYRMRLSDAPEPAPPALLRIESGGGRVSVDTGAVRFQVNRTGPFLETASLGEADFVLRSDERIYKAGRWADTELTVEEQNPLRVVIKRTGAHGWVDGKDRALDYVLRIYAYAGRPHVKLVYSFVNRQGSRMSDFVRLDGLWLEGKLSKTAEPARVDQLEANPRRQGWFEAGGVGVGLRWFWQLYPKGFEARRDGTMRLALFPDSAPPQNIYMGVAKTHEMILSFGGESLAAQVEDPLYALAPPKWYTRGTGALGRIVESSPEAYKPKYWPLVEQYDRWLRASRDAVLAKRDEGFEFRGLRHDEYGMLNFGDAMHKLVANDARPDYGVHWETEYYDFPHALFLHFFRTGDLKSLRTAIEASAHLADVDICHKEVTPGRDGAPRTGPGLNHWVRYSNGVFMTAGWAFYKNESLFDRYLLTGDAWSRDVARLSADYGVNSNDFDLDSNTRSIGHGMFAMLKAYEVFGDSKYLERANWIVDTVHAWQDGDQFRLRRLNPRLVWDAQFKGGYSHQSWMYGIALEGMAQASQTTKRKEMPEYMRRAAEWIFQNPREWDPVNRKFLNAPVHGVMLTPGLAYIAETSKDRKYWAVAMENFERQVKNEPPTPRLKLFAQLFRNSQRFLWYLSKSAGVDWED